MAPAVVYHVEIRQFPHNTCRFNMTEAELRVIADPWSRMEWVEVGERKWSPHQAKLKILRGPEIPLEQLSMGRGWPTARREGEDVTEQVLAACRSTPAAASPGPSTAATQAPPPAATVSGAGPAEALLGELAPLLGDDPQTLLEAWRHAAALYRNSSPSESLALAERAIGSPGEG